MDINTINNKYTNNNSAKIDTNNANTYNNIQVDQQQQSDQYLKNDIINISEEGSTTQTDEQDKSFTHNYIEAKNAYLNRNNQDKEEKEEIEKANTDENNDTDIKGEKLDNQEQQELDDLKQRQNEVVTHENQHKAVGGSLAQAPSYSYTTGPDGNRYISDGEVSIDVSQEEDPKDTITKMQKVQAAALAPAQPSNADRQVAAQAANIEAQARAELNKEQQEDPTKVIDKNSDNQNNNNDNISKQDSSQTIDPDVINKNKQLDAQIKSKN